MNLVGNIFRHRLLAPLSCGVLSTICVSGLCLTSLVLAFKYPNCSKYECAPERSFDLEDLNMAKELFPEDAEVNILHPMNGKEGAEEAVITANYWDGMGGLAIYQVYRYSTIEGAREKFNFTKQSFFFHKREKPLVPMPELIFISSNTDEFYIGCGNVHLTYRCGFVAQYQEHVLFFNAIIDKKMTIQDFGEVVEYLDFTMETLLEAEVDSQ